MATSDDDGKFQITNLAPAHYVIRVAAAGYVPEFSQAATPATFYRPGEDVTFRMIKGGVITGRVVNQNNQPIALARVRALRVRDDEGNPVRDSAVRDWTTDDRGVYRTYGLEAGAYVVAANLTIMFRPAPSQLRVEESSEAAPTYHPSATLDTATLVNVVNGHESGGIDIRYRPEHSYAVRGTVMGGTAQADAPLRRGVVSVTLSHAASGVAVAFTTIVPASGNNAFDFDGVPDGAYELTAQAAPGTSDAALAPPQRINVRGASVSDIVLTLAPMGLVSGRVLIERATSTEAVEPCGEVSKPVLQETLITASSAETERKTKQLSSLAALLPIEARPDAHGEFLLTNVNAGKYSLNVRPQNSRWYVRDIAWEPGPATASSTPVQSRLHHLTLKSGERLQGLTIRLAHGAASVSGRVSAAVANAALPSRLKVYAVPVKRELADDVLRYAAAQVQPDGTFSLEQLAPERYWLLVDADVKNETRFLEVKTRATLRRDAERANVAVDLQPCRQLAGYTLRFMP
jgi:hypothetical protein